MTGERETLRGGRLEVDIRVVRRSFRLDTRFDAPAQGITVLFGRSGAGKTTVVEALAGLLQPDDGRIALDGKTLFDRSAGVHVPPQRRRIGYVFQEGRLFPHLSVRANLLYGVGRGRRTARERALEGVVALLDIGHLLQRRPGGLSGGEKQRVAIGRALLTNPRLLLMDEPLASLDPAMRSDLLPYVERLRDEERIPIVYVSHSVEDIVRLADTLVLMSDGGVAAAGSVVDLMSRLDLRPLTGRYEAGAVIEAQVLGHDEADGLTRLAFPGGVFRVPMVKAPVTGKLRVRVRARDVSLALEPPRAISILNVFLGRVRELAPADGRLVDVMVALGPDGDGPLLWARVTPLSVRNLGLAADKPVHALVKAIAIDRHSIAAARTKAEDTRHNREAIVSLDPDQR